jgi:hypothetical protein
MIGRLLYLVCVLLDFSYAVDGPIRGGDTLFELGQNSYSASLVKGGDLLSVRFGDGAMPESIISRLTVLLKMPNGRLLVDANELNGDAILQYIEFGSNGKSWKVLVAKRPDMLPFIQWGKPSIAEDHSVVFSQTTSDGVVATYVAGKDGFIQLQGAERASYAIRGISSTQELLSVFRSVRPIPDSDLLRFSP